MKVTHNTLLKYGWHLSDNGNPMRVVNDVLFTVFPYPENRAQWTYVVGGIFANRLTSFVSPMSAMDAAEEAYDQHLGNPAINLASYRERASILRGRMQKRAPKRNFAEEYRTQQKRGDVPMSKDLYKAITNRVDALTDAVLLSAARFKGEAATLTSTSNE